ncbi:MAG: FMN-dependent NADH-azoreductase [Candidatus Eremiobacteraeota bacterium]|nr:FMN-dependent NADH-azoreductase [Candidatus Eremiobacteraeota bacterium]MCW5866224.1 FMN-dependent NADH-azoreductase [Candidatus Eremiobacteraeota bacterium]
MNHLLHIHSSANLQNSTSRQIGGQLVAHLRENHPGLQIVERDLARHPLPHIDENFISVIYSQPDHPNLKLSNQLVDELLKADVIVLEAAMYNFGIPSTLKAWIDHVARAGRTFTYQDGSPRGLLTGKKLYLVLGSGGVYSSGPRQAFDFQEPYLRSVLGFLGLTDVEVVRIEGTAMGQTEQALRAAQEKIATA